MVQYPVQIQLSIVHHYKLDFEELVSIKLNK
jgi:hypothetical protein